MVTNKARTSMRGICKTVVTLLASSQHEARKNLVRAYDAPLYAVCAALKFVENFKPDL